MITLYGIPNCDQIKKARKWLDTHKIDYRFHDYRKDGISKTQLKLWAKELGWESLLNKHGTTWRKLSADDRANVNTRRAIELMAAQPAMIKRPLLDTGKHKLLGFNSDDYQQLHSSHF